MRDDRKRNSEGMRWIVTSGMTLPRGEKQRKAIRAWYISSPDDEKIDIAHWERNHTPVPLHDCSSDRYAK
jgi:hypothetical protein